MEKIVIFVPETMKKVILGQSLIPTGKSRLGWVGIGFAIQSALVVALLLIPLLFPSAIRFLPHYWVTNIETPVVQPWKPQPKRSNVIAHQQPKSVVKEPTVTEIAPPRPSLISPILSSPVKKADPHHTSDSAPDVPEVAQNPSAIGSSAIPTLRKPRYEVQTGGFGDPGGVPANGNTSISPNVAQLGNYENPVGPGNGNGSGGAKGVPGATLSSGFGNGTASGSSRRGGGPIQQGMFADGAGTAITTRIRPVVVTAARTRSVQILFKPKPKYTQEARANKIEGDVSLEVLFRSSGQVEVQRVISGLGYGLDESAQAAAREIRFQPALRDGEPADFSAIVHITFALAY